MLASLFPIKFPLGTLLRQRAERSPKGICWREAERLHTWKELELTALSKAEDLQQYNIFKGECATWAALCAHPSFQSLAAQFGAAIAGMPLGHIPPNSTPSELIPLLLTLQPQLIWLDPAQLPAFQTALADSQLQAIQPAPQLVLLKDIPPLKNLYPTIPSISVESPLHVLFTSGTSGPAKGVVISHRAKLAHALMHVKNLDLQENDVIWCALPLHHQFGQWLVIAAMLAGATLFFRSSFDACQCWQDIAQEGITHLPAVPTMLVRLLAEAPANIQAPALRQVVYGAAPVQAAIVQQLRKKLPKVKWFQGFGQTEAGLCLGLDEAGHLARPDSLGRPGEGCEIRLVDDKGGDVPPGQAGELAMRTPCMMEGYLNDPHATQAFFSLGDHWGRSGDLARQDADGFYVYLGRLNDVVISGGLNIHPNEIEAALKKHVAVADAAVIGLPHPQWGEALTAVLVALPNKPLPDTAVLKAHCQKQLASWKHPKNFVWHEVLPKTANGKIQRSLLRQQLLKNSPT